MKNWIILAAVVVSFAMCSEADAHWYPRRFWAYSGYGYPVYSTYYPAPVYAAPRAPGVGYYGYYGPVVRPVYAPSVVAYPPAVYSTYYGGPGGYYCGW